MVNIWLFTAPDYTGTRILSLPDCKDIGGEERDTYGFCPADYYVPYYVVEKWYMNDKEYTSTIWEPSKEDYDDIHEILSHAYTPFGFVAGCAWGDDSSWKIQYLDLSKADEGIVKRDDRFGYIEMPENIARLSDCVNMCDYGEEKSDYIRILFSKGFHVTTGKAEDY